MAKFLSPEAVERMFKLAESSYRPPQIVKLKEEIEGEIRVANSNALVTGSIDLERVQKIVGMKLNLDHLFGLWAEGKIE